MRILVDELPKKRSECPFCEKIANYWGCTLYYDLSCALLCTGKCDRLIALNEMSKEEN